MKIALISDIHGNFDALSAVFEHIDSLGDVERVICLGDVVGYGPEPEQCIDLLLKRCELTLMGNHDYALLNSPIGFNPVAAKAIECTRERMQPGLFSFPRTRKRWDYLSNLPERHELDEDLLVHASPRDNIFEYILPDDPVYDAEKINDIFTMFERRCYVGHTHRPGIIDQNLTFRTPADLDGHYDFTNGDKLIINVSSVGQPRDHDPRACYAVVTDECIDFHRVEYDVESVIQKVHDNPCLDDYCGDRLKLGK